MILPFCERLTVSPKNSELMKKFQVFSSLTINVEKCEASWIGRAKNQTSKLVKCKWTSLTKSCIKILGTRVDYGRVQGVKCHKITKIYIKTPWIIQI